MTILGTGRNEFFRIWPGANTNRVEAEGVDREHRQLVLLVHGPDASQIPGIGEGALFTTEPKSYNATAKAYVAKAKGVLVVLTFHGGNALAQKDRLIRLLKLAVSAL